MYVDSTLVKTWTSVSNTSFIVPYNFTENTTSIINISATDIYDNYNVSLTTVYVLPSVTETTVNLTANDSVNITANATTGADLQLSTGTIQPMSPS